MAGTSDDATMPVGGWTSEIRRTLTLALPMVAAYLAELGMWWTDQAIVGRLGADALAAVGLSGSMLFMGIMMAMGLLSIVAVLAGNAFGAGRPEGVARAVRQGLHIATALTAGIMVYAWFVPDILALAGQDPVIVELAAAYVRAFLWRRCSTSRCSGASLPRSRGLSSSPSSRRRQSRSTSVSTSCWCSAAPGRSDRWS